MFFDPEIDWLSLHPVQIMTLRACAPSGVFSITAKGGYLTQVGGNTDRSDLADAMFATSDTEFLARLPKKWQSLKPQLKTLMQLASEHGIR